MKAAWLLAFNFCSQAETLFRSTSFDLSVRRWKRRGQDRLPSFPPWRHNRQSANFECINFVNRIEIFKVLTVWASQGLNHMTSDGWIPASLKRVSFLFAPRRRHNSLFQVFSQLRAAVQLCLSAVTLQWSSQRLSPPMAPQLLALALRRS